MQSFCLLTLFSFKANKTILTKQACVLYSHGTRLENTEQDKTTKAPLVQKRSLE